MVVLGARAAAEQVRGDTGIPTGRLGPGCVVEDELHVDVQDVQRLIAADVARVGLPGPVQLVPARHDRLAPRPSRPSSVGRAGQIPLAASAARNLRRASNIVL